MKPFVFNSYMTHKLFVFNLIIAILLLASCNKGIRILEVTSDNDNALRSRITVRTSNVSHITLEYSKITDSSRVYMNESKNKDNHIFILNGLIPNSEYEYKLELIDNDRKTDYYTGKFRTDKLPDSLPDLQLIIDSTNVFNGYILVKKVEDPGQHILINSKGNIIWFHQIDTILAREFSWTPRNTIVSLIDENRLVEFDINGDLLFELNRGEKGFDKPLHHEIIKDSEGNFISLTRIQKVFDLTHQRGTEADSVFGDGILVMDKTGNMVWNWDLFKFMNPLEDKNIYKMKKDWSHANGLDMDEEENFYVCFRNFHQVWKISRQSGEVIWKLGMNGDFSFDESDLFVNQHSAHINCMGELMLFDNGGPPLSESRALSFKFGDNENIEKGEIEVSLPKDLYSFKEGSAYLIDGDKILFCSTRTNYIVITDLKGQILWQLKTSHSFYRAVYIEKLEAGFENNFQ